MKVYKRRACLALPWSSAYCTLCVCVCFSLWVAQVGYTPVIIGSLLQPILDMKEVGSVWKFAEEFRRERDNGEIGRMTRDRFIRKVKIALAVAMSIQASFALVDMRSATESFFVIKTAACLLAGKIIATMTSQSNEFIVLIDDSPGQYFQTRMTA